MGDLSGGCGDRRHHHPHDAAHGCSAGACRRRRDCERSSGDHCASDPHRIAARVEGLDQGLGGASEVELGARGIGLLERDAGAQSHVFGRAAVGVGDLGLGQAGLDLVVEIDGGVTPETAPLVAAAGADVLVAGSAVFRGGSVQNPAPYGQNIRAIRQAAELWGKAKTSFLLHARGIEHHSHGVQNVLGAINMVLASGRIGRENCGYATITGQANGQGGREHGQKCDQLPGARDISNPEHRAFIANIWGIDEKEMPGAGVDAYELIRRIDRGEIKGLLSLCFNPLVSLPDNRFVRQALEKLDRAVAAAPTDPRVLEARGSVLTMLGRKEEAVASYEASLGIAPSEALRSE